MARERIPFLGKTFVAGAILCALLMGVWFGRSLWIGQPKAETPSQSPAAPADLYADTLQKVRGIIAQKVATVPEVVAPAMPLDDLGVDELTRLDIASALEGECQVRLTDAELAAVQTVDDLVQLVTQKREAARAK